MLLSVANLVFFLLLHVFGQVGDHIGYRYEVLGTLGRGSFGQARTKGNFTVFRMWLSACHHLQRTAIFCASPVPHRCCAARTTVRAAMWHLR